MSTNKHVDKICIAVVLLMLVITVFFMFGEKFGITVIHKEDGETTSGMFTDNDLNADWDTTGATTIVLNGDSAKISGTGSYFSDNILHIASAGKYVISGNLNGSIYIDADSKDKLWLLFDDVEITSNEGAPLYINQADKVFLTLKENSKNTLTFENNDEDSEIDGSIFSRDDLTINGKGSLTITSSSLHGIVCNDSLVFTGGNININAKNDAVHAHDAIKICNTTFNISAGDDGLHAGNDDETSIFYLESGVININECYEGIEANDVTIAGGTVNILPSDDGINANGSTAASLITISGGDISIVNKNGRDADGLDSNGSINITGGNLFISVSGSGTNNSIDYGSENNGKFLISGGTIVACGSSQMAEGPDSESTQGFIMQTVSGNENSTLSVFDSSGKEIINKEIPCSFTSVIISSPEILVGDTVKLKIGNTETDITVTNTFEPGEMQQVPGEMQQRPDEMQQGPGEMQQGPGGMQQGPGGMQQRPDDNVTPPEKPEDLQNSNMSDLQEGTPPEKPDGEGQEGTQIFDENISDEMQESNDTNSISVTTWIWLGASILVLVVGIFIALKKKY